MTFLHFLKLHNAARYDDHKQSFVKCVVINRLCLTPNYYRNI